MKYKIVLLFIFITILFSKSYAQNEHTQEELKSAKDLFNSTKDLYADELDTFNYHRIVVLLNKVLQADPTNPEALYYLGYTYSRINSSDGRSIISMNKDLVMQSSAYFEKLNQLTPKYTGEIIALDPYSKITAEWGSMAMSYIYNNQLDSALWAFNQGKERGGYSPFVLEINRKTLDACPPNSILISAGDNITFPIWYLQEVEKYRTDISVIDISLLNTSWYPRFVSKNKNIVFDLPDNVIDTIDYMPWMDSLIKVGDFSWILKPSLYEQYILRGDRVLLSLIKANNFKRDIYFTASFDKHQQISLEDYLSDYIVVKKLCKSTPKDLIYEEYKNKITEILKLSSYINPNSIDQINTYNFYRCNIIMQIDKYYKSNDLKKAKELMSIFDTYADDKRMDYDYKLLSDFVIELKVQLKSTK
ncbi:MAG: tetratricopeptide repeat protein [Bacteroidota bacterium]